MKKDFFESNIVMLGNFTPSLFDKLFFIKNGLFSENDFLDSSIFTPNFAQIITKSLIFSIDEKRIVIINKAEDNYKKLEKSAEIIINTVNNDIKIIGYNFKWILFINTEITKYTKSKFYTKSNITLNKFFNSDKTAYGYYISDDFLDSRMKLDIKPNVLQEVNTSKSKNVLSFDFNFHIEKTNENTFINSIKKYNLYLNRVKEIISNYE